MGFPGPPWAPCWTSSGSSLAGGGRRGPPGIAFEPLPRRKIVPKPWKNAISAKMVKKSERLSNFLKTAKIGLSCRRELNFEEKWRFLHNLKSQKSRWHRRKSAKFNKSPRNACIFLRHSKMVIFEGCPMRNARFLRIH